MKIRPFREGDTFTTFDNLIKSVTREIGSLDNDYVLKASISELERYYIDKVTIQPLILHPDEHYIESQTGTKVDVSDDFRRAIFPGERASVQGTSLEIAIPFEGNRDLWKLQPSRFTLSGYPEINVHDDRMVFSITFPDDSPDSTRLKSQIDAQIQSLVQAVADIRRDVENHNKSAPIKVKSALEQKRTKALAASNAITNLGIPIKRRATPPTFTVPTRRRKSPVERPKVPTEEYKPEPVLDAAEYEHILEVIRSMSLVIERSPGSFASLDEESIRTHFLFQLNGHYEGDATGETFNASGKTDILIRVENRNIFIAECKFWRGPKGFSDAIDQLLGYLSWRDSKCALIVFNRTRDSSAIREKMHEIMESRSEYRKTVLHEADGDSRYIFVKKSDPGREIVITTMLFDVPSD